MGKKKQCIVQGNAEIYREWLRKKGNISLLKDSLSLNQFRKVEKELKLLWVLVDGGKVPFVVSKKTTVKELERKIVPWLVRVFEEDPDEWILRRVRLVKIMKNCPLPIVLNDKNFWSEIEDDSVLNFDKERYSCCCFPCCSC